MADEKSEEPEFWLPSEFLTDDDIVMFSGISNKIEFSNSETESDDDQDLLAGFTHQFTRTSLDETLNSKLPQKQHLEKSWVHSGSPQSTLTQDGIWSGRSTGSRNCTPNGSSTVTRPPLMTQSGSTQNEAWYQIYQAADRVARLKVTGGEMGPTRNLGLIPGPPRRGPASSPTLRTLNSGFTDSHFARGEQMVRQKSCAVWNGQVKNGWLNEHVCQNRGLRSGFGDERWRSVGGEQAWSAPLFEYQRLAGSGMTAGFLGGYGGGVIGKKRECAGTGVFLPRRYDSCTPTDSSKNSGCSTAWFPGGVVQSLNKNFDDFTVIPQSQSQPKINSGFLTEFEMAMARRSTMLAQQQRRNMNMNMLRHEGGALNFETRLPQEWTY